MTPVRAPAVVRGDVPGLLRRGMPVAPADIGAWVESSPRGFRSAKNAHAVVIQDPPYSGKSINLSDGWGNTEPHLVTIDFTDRTALYLSLHWLADRGHPGCLWMLPTTHGGRVEAWSGLTAWEVSAIVVSVSVGRVARGVGPVSLWRDWRRYDAAPPRWSRRPLSPMDEQPNIMAWVNVTPVGTGWRFGFMRGPETGDAGKLAADTAALADGCALLVPGGLVVPV